MTSASVKMWKRVLRLPLPMEQTELAINVDLERLERLIYGTVKVVTEGEDRSARERRALHLPDDEAEIQRLQEVSKAFIHGAVSSGAFAILHTALAIFMLKVITQSIEEAVQAEQGDAATRLLKRAWTKNIQKVVNYSFLNWYPDAPKGRHAARTPEEKAELRERLDRRFRELKAEKVREGVRRTRPNVLAELALEFGMSESSIEHALRKPKETKSAAQRTTRTPSRKK